MRRWAPGCSTSGWWWTSTRAELVADWAAVMALAGRLVEVGTVTGRDAFSTLERAAQEVAA